MQASDETPEPGARPPATVYRKKDLVDAVAAASGVKKKQVKPVVEAVLAELGLALARGEALNMPPLGRVAVNRSRAGAQADVLILKLRRSRPGAAPEPDEPTVDAAE
jgi:DNA-binding protein HU-alpha